MVIKKLESSLSLTKTDLDIIRFLKKDPRNLSRIARNLNLSFATLYSHVKKLEKEGIIKAYIANLDSEKVGFMFTVLIFVRRDGRYYEDVEKKLAIFKAIEAIYDITGEYDMLIIARYRSLNTFYDFIKQLKGWPNIKKIVTSVTLDIIKENYTKMV